MKAHAKATPSESTPRRAMRLAMLLTLAFLLVPAVQASANEILEVDIEGSGAGEVIPASTNYQGIPPINCAYASPGPATGQCEVQMSNEGEGYEAVFMKAVPAPGSEFVEWKIEEGAYEQCNVSFPPNSPKGEFCLPYSEPPGSGGAKLTAVFKESVPHYDLALSKAGTGEGDLAIECEEGSGFVPCTSPIEEGMEVKVSASAKAGSALSELTGTGGAQGNCAIETTILGSCTFTIAEDSSVSATFATAKLTVTKLSNGKGTVTSSPEGIECGATCKANFVPGTVVTLTATPDAGSKLKGWSGCDSVVGEECTVTMSANRALSATFTTKPKIEEQSAQPHDTTATLRATINPNGETTTYQFEYLSEAQYQANGEDFSGAIKVPASPASIGEGNEGVLVAHPIGGLTPQSTYRYRLQAVNAVDSVEAQGAFTTYPSDPSFGACPQNEASRLNLPSAALPDCRAYEQATPINKNSGNLQSSLDSLKASANGDRVSFESIASFPGAEGAQTEGIYLATRGTEDWSTQGLLLPGSLTSISSVTGWTPDLAQVFDTAGRRTSEGAETALFSRSSADGSLAMVAPYTLEASYSFRSASADGSKALFSAGVSGGKLTEDAAQGKSNLYTWDRETGDLHLAGVLPDGTTPPGGSETVNSGYSQDLRTVAADGSAYFAAGNPEQLYLRQNPTAPETTAVDGEGNCVPDPAHACTLHVSASEKAVPDPGGPLRATFQHASADGSVAYFTSSQELTDDAHTIAPPHTISSANLDGSIANSLLLPGANAAAVAIDGSHIYWVDRAAGTIGRAELDGQNPEPSCITGADHPQGIAVGVGSDSNHLYWTNAKDGAAGTGTIGRADIGGSCAAAQSSANESFITGATNPRGIDTDGSYLYWGNGGLQATHGVGRAAVSGAGVNQLFADAEDFREVKDVAADPAHNHLYIARGAGSNIVRVNLDDGTARVGLSASNAQQIALDANHLYWTIATDLEGATTNIGRSDLDGSNENTNFIAVQSPSGIAVNASHIYWGTHPTGRGTDLYRFDAEAPVGERLSDVMPVPTALTGAEVQGVLGTSEDGSYVYFAANGAPAGVLNSPNANGESPVSGGCKGSPDGTVPTASGICNLYLAHAGQVTFIARLDAGGAGSQGDAFNWKLGRVGGLRTSRVSADGETLLFRSQRQLTAYVNKSPQCFDPNHCIEFYRYQAGDPGPICISCNPTGAPPSGRAPTLGSMRPVFLGSSSPVSLLSRNLSADGNRVFFETNDALLAADTNGDESCKPWGSANQASFLRSCQDVYEWEAKGTGSCESEAQNGGCLYLLSTGKSKDASFFVDASTEGEDAFVLTTSQLVRRDKDTLLDIFDARIGGGLAKQNAIPPVPCEGEACRDKESTPAQAPTPATQSFTAPGNPKAVHKKARKTRKHKKRRKKQRHAKGQRRAAKTTGRASR